jgi:hypothetical protein
MKDASAGAEISTNCHLGNHPHRRDLQELDPHETREERLEKLLERRKVRHGLFSGA